MVTKYPPSTYPDTTTEKQPVGASVPDHRGVSIIGVDHRGMSSSSDSPTQQQIRPEAASRSRYRPTDRDLNNQTRGAVEGMEEAIGAGAGGGDDKGYYEDEEVEEDVADVDVEYRHEYSNNTPSSNRSSRPTATNRRYQQSQSQAPSQLQSQSRGMIREEETSYSSQPQQPPPQRTVVHEYYATANGGGYHPMSIQPSSQHSPSQGGPFDNGSSNRPYNDRSYTDHSPYTDNNPYGDGLPYAGLSRQESDMTSNRGILMTPQYLTNNPAGSNANNNMQQVFGENVREHSMHSLDADGMVQWYQGTPPF